MNVLVIGSGGREHALAWKLRQSGLVRKVFCAPGNPGMAGVATLVPVKVSDLAGLVDLARREAVDLTVVGPENPLADGIVDLFHSRGLTIFGPTKEAAALEWSKAFAKDFMQRHNIPTAASVTFTRDQAAQAYNYVSHCHLPVVLKADGLAAGKGVVICTSRAEAHDGLAQMIDARAFGDAGTTVVIEEYMEGVEASVFAVTDGERFVTLVPAQDHKRVFDNDQGKNTGGMGSYAPTPCVTPGILGIVRERIITPTLRGMAAEGKPYRGCLYAGLMLTTGGPKVVEFNSRFGDPESQVVLPLYQGDLAALLYAAACERLLETEAPLHQGSSVCVVLASPGYPDAYATGLPITGLNDLAGMEGIIVFHAGTRREGENIVTAGGRVLGITACLHHLPLGDTIALAYRAVEKVSFPGMHYRRDIGQKGLAR